MARRSGITAKVTFGTYTVAGLGTWTMDGASRATVEDNQFGDDVNGYLFGPLDGGTLSFEGNYDPDDSTGQAELDSACINKSHLGPGQLKLYIDNTSYYDVGTSGTLLVTKCRAISTARNGLATISISAKVSRASMYLV